MINKGRQGSLGASVDPDLLIRIGVPDSLAKRTLNALRSLGLIDDDGALSDSFRALIEARPGDYQSQLAEFLRGAYAEIFGIIDPATATPEQLRNAFWGYEPRGQIDNMVRLFLGLCDEAGLRPDRPKVERTVGRRVRKPRTTGSGTSREAEQLTEHPPAPSPAPPPSQEIDPAILQWIKRMPSPLKPWPKADKDRWFAALRAMADGIWPEDGQHDKD